MHNAEVVDMAGAAYMAAEWAAARMASATDSFRNAVPLPCGKAAEFVRKVVAIFETSRDIRTPRTCTTMVRGSATIRAEATRTSAPITHLPTVALLAGSGPLTCFGCAGGTRRGVGLKGSI